MSILGSLGGMLAKGAILRTESTLLGPPELKVRQDLNRLFTNELPGPDGIFSALNSGRILDVHASGLLAYANIDWTGKGFGKDKNYHQTAWEAVRQAMLPVPGMDAIIRGWSHGLISDRRTNEEKTPLEKLIERAGAEPFHWRWVKNLSLAVPDPGTIHQAFTRGYIDFDEWKQLLIRSGARDFHWNAVLPAYEAVPSVAETLNLYNRRFIDDKSLDDLLHRNGFADQNNRELIKNLRFAIPSISDLITMQVRETFDPKLANALGLYDESPSSIIPYFEAQGLNWTVTKPDRVTPLVGSVDGNPRPLTWPDMYWAMHWRPFSPEQVFRMWHLLRPERIERYKGRGLRVEPTDLEFVRQWLRIQDYPPRVRDYLAAIAFTPLRLIDIRSALQTGVAADAWARDNNLPAPIGEAARQDFSRKWAIQQYLDRGVHPADAEVQADLAIEQLRRRRLSAVTNLERSSLGRFLANTINEYKTGILNRAGAEEILKTATLPEPAIRLVLDNADNEVSSGIVKETLKLIRRRYLDGVSTAADVRTELNRVGISAERGTQYINLWTAQRTQRSRTITTAKIQEWARDGLLPFDEARRRLENLGWSQPDTLLHLAEIQLDINKVQVAAIQAADKTQRAQAKELERLIKLSQQQQERMVAELRRLTPVATLKKWLKLGIVSEAFFQQRMATLGYPANEIILHMQEVYASGTNGATQNPPSGPTTETTEPAPSP